jgi:hypothetical protein
MRTVMAVVVFVGLTVGSAVPGRAEAQPETQAHQAGLAIGAAAANLVYLPAKSLVAAVGLAVGGLVGALTGGDQGAAYAVMVPLSSGTFLLQPQHLDGTKPIDFFGVDYADRPSTYRTEMNANSIYESRYQSKSP